MTASIYEYNFQAIDLSVGRALNQGGKFKVVAANGTAAIALTDADGIATPNPVTLNKGVGTFYTQTSVGSVDIYGMTDKGYAFVAKGIKPGETGSILINTFNLNQTLLIPFNFADAGVSGTLENDTGFTLPNQVLLNPVGVGVKVVTAQAGKSIDLGIKSTSGVTDADGLIDGALLSAVGVALGMVGYVVGTNSVFLDLTGGDQEWTLGALYHPANTKQVKAEGTDSATTKNGMAILKPHVPNALSAAVTESITFTGVSTPTTAAGFFVIPLTITEPAN